MTQEEKHQLKMLCDALCSLGLDDMHSWDYSPPTNGIAFKKKSGQVSFVRYGYGETIRKGFELIALDRSQCLADLSQIHIMLLHQSAKVDQILSIVNP